MVPSTSPGRTVRGEPTRLLAFALVALAMLAGTLLAPAAPASAASGSPPVANPDAAAVVSGQAVTVSPLVNDSDPDPGTTLVLAAVGVATPAGGVATPAGNDVVVTTVAGFVGQLVVAYTVSDGSLTANGSIAVNVVPPNRPPVAVADVGHMPPGGVLRVDPRGNDSDPDGEPLTVASAVVSAGAGTVALEGSVLAIGSTAGVVGPLVITYVVADPRGGQAQSTVTIDVIPNRAPVVGSDAVKVRVGEVTPIPVLANDSDPDGDPVSLVGVGRAKHGKATMAGADIVYQAPRSWTGKVRIRYAVADPSGAVTKGTLTVRVFRRAAAPTPTPAPPPTAEPQAPAEPPPDGARSSRREVEAALARLGLPTGRVNGSYDAQSRRAVCAWRVVTSRPASRRLPSASEARAIVSTGTLPRATSSMVTGVNVAVTCQAAFWVSSNGEYRRVMPATTGKVGFRTRLGVHRVFLTHHVWRYSTIYPEARMYKPMQFSGGQALHGSATDRLVKTYPASHGCVRMLHRDIDAMQAGGVGNGTAVRVFGTW